MAKKSTKTNKVSEETGNSTSAEETKAKKSTAGKKSAAKKSAAAKKSSAKSAASKSAAKKSVKKTAAKKVTKKAAKKSAESSATSKKSDESKGSASKKAAKRSVSRSSPKSASKKSATKKSAAKSSAKNIAVEEIIQTSVDTLEEHDRSVASDRGSIAPTQRNTTRTSIINGNHFFRQVRDSRAPKTEQNIPVISYKEPVEELPKTYNYTSITCLVKDSEWIFVYWDLSAESWNEYQKYGDQGALCLRLHRIASSDSQPLFEDAIVSDSSNSWYLYVPKAGREYCVELGIKNISGEFHVLARSNNVFVPTLEVAAEMVNEVSGNDLEAYRQILKLSGAGTLVDNISSGTFSADLVRRLTLAPSSFSGALFSGSFISSAFASETMAARTSSLIDGQDRKFWLVVDAEVIVYGATEPDARVKFMGKEIRLNPDGTFGIRMALPDGNIEFPVEATSADGEETRKVRPVVQRTTEDE